MVKSTGISGVGTSLEIWQDSYALGYLPIANLMTIGVTGRSTDQVDNTPVGTTDGMRETLPGYRSPGSVPFTFQFSPAELSHQTLVELWQSSERFEFRIDYGPYGLEYSEYGVGWITEPGDTSLDGRSPTSGQASIHLVGVTELAENGLTLDSSKPLNSPMFMLGWI